MMEQPSYYSILTADVRYDKRLSDFAKVLFSDITALCRKRGYCNATNEYFMTIFCKSRRSINSTLAALADAEYIAVEVVRDDQNAVVERRIWVDVNARKNEEEQGQKSAESCTTPRAENCMTPRAENCTYNNTSNNNTPIIPTGTTESTELFDRFWAAYPKHVAKKPARRAWDKLHADAGLLDTILTALEWQKREQGWQRDGGRYIPNPATWLNARRWEDEKQAGAPERKPKGSDYEQW